MADELYIDGKPIRRMSDIRVTLYERDGLTPIAGEHVLSVVQWNGARPTRRQRVGALVRRVLRRKVGA